MKRWTALILLCWLLASLRPAAGADNRRIRLATPFGQGAALVAAVRSDAPVTNLTVRAYGLAPGAATTYLLAQDSQPEQVFDDLSDGVAVVALPQPLPLKRLVTEIISTTAQDLDLYLARDANGDGAPQPAELINSSATGAALEYIDQTDPVTGTYFLLIHNYAGGGGGPDSVTLSVGKVGRAGAGNLAAVGPATAPAGAPFDMTLLWDIAGAQVGQRWYGAFDAGTDPAHPGNIGYFPVDLLLVPIERRFLPLVSRG
ncbi:MAG TPA: hypothetical protein VGE07_22700 [Herpetosiphonaceae bacterium]